MSYVPVRSELNNNGHALASEKKLFSSLKEDASSYSIIVHSHLCWDWVWQRPQQFISRLSQKHKVLFVEMVAPDGSLAAPMARFQTPERFPNLTVLQLQFPAWRWNDGAYVDAERRRLVQEFLAGPGAGHFDQPVQWFYDPMAVPAFLGKMGEVLTVYDCMDELSKFRFAPPEIIEREGQLLAAADVVFAGGRRLSETKKQFNENCHFYGCGVDWEHFGKASDAAMKPAREMEAIARPVLGYFGVADERLDYDLIAKLAEANPNWSIVIIGPVLKVEESSLPRRANLHWLGQQPYERLPAFCKSFDVCLMPFALNESTQFINPTKTLEYMATSRQIVSTAVPDVVRNFGEVVKIAESCEQFIEFCRQAVEQKDGAAIARGLRMARENSWDAIVAKLEGHIEEAMASKPLGKRANGLLSPARSSTGGEGEAALASGSSERGSNGRLSNRRRGRRRSPSMRSLAN